MTIGERLRRARLARRMSLAALGQASQLSKGFLSQVESGATNASVASLRRLAQALAIPLSALVEDAAVPVSLPSDFAPILARHTPLQAARSSVAPVSTMRAGTVATAQLRQGAYLEPRVPRTMGEEAGATGSDALYCMALQGELRFRQKGHSLSLRGGDSLTWASGEPWVLENQGISLASLLLFIPAGVAVPDAIDDKSGQVRIGPPPLSLQGHTGVNGPLKLVEMRAIRSGRGR